MTRGAAARRATSCCGLSVTPLPDWQSPEGRDDPQTGRIVELRSGGSWDWQPP
ncbi:hypothetical protein QM331_32170, partial [Pseudomonas aeruginosa]|nr:hypothetical protein [Pseudomonas aeruginosa]